MLLYFIMSCLCFRFDDLLSLKINFRKTILKSICNCKKINENFYTIFGLLNNLKWHLHRLWVKLNCILFIIFSSLPAKISNTRFSRNSRNWRLAKIILRRRVIFLKSEDTRNESNKRILNADLLQQNNKHFCSAQCCQSLH